MDPSSDAESEQSEPTDAAPISENRPIFTWNALVKSARERRTKRALFFALASLMIGFTVAGQLGVAVCGTFGGSLYLVVLVLRMQRHL